MDFLAFNNYSFVIATEFFRISSLNWIRIANLNMGDIIDEHLRKNPHTNRNNQFSKGKEVVIDVQLLSRMLLVLVIPCGNTQHDNTDTTVVAILKCLHVPISLC